MTKEEEKIVDATTEYLSEALTPKGWENDKLVSFKLIIMDCSEGGKINDNPTKEDWLNLIKQK